MYLAVAAGGVVADLLRPVYPVAAYLAMGPVVWIVLSTVFSGPHFPLRFLPGWAAARVWILTPFPSTLQAPLDVVVERVSPSGQVGLLAGQMAGSVPALAARKASG